MLTRIIAIIALSCPLLAVATPSLIARDARTTACCASTEPANSAAGTAILESIGVSVSDVNALVGLSCSPVSVIGVGSGAACDGSTVTCMNGLVGSVGVGCVPITPL